MMIILHSPQKSGQVFLCAAAECTPNFTPSQSCRALKKLSVDELELASVATRDSQFLSSMPGNVRHPAHEKIPENLRSGCGVAVVEMQWLKDDPPNTCGTAAHAIVTTFAAAPNSHYLHRHSHFGGHVTPDFHRLPKTSTSLQPRHHTSRRALLTCTFWLISL